MIDVGCKVNCLFQLIEADDRLCSVDTPTNLDLD